MWGAILAGVTSLVGIKQGRDAAKSQSAAAKARQQISDLQNFQQRVGFLNQFMSTEADFFSAGVQSGAGLGSSGVQGTMASARSQAAGRIGEYDELSRLGGEYSTHLGDAARRTQYANAALTMGGMFATHAGSIDAGIEGAWGSLTSGSAATSSAGWSGNTYSQNQALSTPGMERK